MARGILSAAAYLPRGRLDRSSIAAVAGTGGASGTRAVASYDEDTTTMGVEAARLTLVGSDPGAVDQVWFSTVAPAYADKTNATAIHAALRIRSAAPAVDANGAVRSAVGALRAALSGQGTALVVSADLRSGLAGGADEVLFGDGAAALVVGDGTADRPVLTELIASGFATEEFLDRWRTPGAARSKVWEERFGEVRYARLGQRAFDEALSNAGLIADELDVVVVTGTHPRAAATLAKQLGIQDRVFDDLTSKVGNTGAAHPMLLLTAALERAEPGQTIALVTLADGADVMVWRTTPSVAGWRPRRAVASQLAGAAVDYGTYLRWRGLLEVEPPRRPSPARPSAAAAGRSADWKFAFVGSADDSGTMHLPPHPSDIAAVPMADAIGTVVAHTIDRLAYSPSPPIVFAVVDFDRGGRLPVELTDVDDLSAVRGGARVELTFRKLFSADDIHNYFWKARLVPEGS